MFDIHRNNKQAPDQNLEVSSQDDSFGLSSGKPAASGRAAVIGPGIHINGDISGEENLLIEGRVDGKIRLKEHQVDIGQCGQVNANISARVIKIAGQVCGDLNASEKVVISHTGNVHGNIVAPRMTLDDGAIFKGSIDMDPGEPEKPKASRVLKSAAAQTTEKPVGQVKTVKPEKEKGSNSYSLNGS